MAVQIIVKEDQPCFRQQQLRQEASVLHAKEVWSMYPVTSFTRQLLRVNGSLSDDKVRCGLLDCSEHVGKLLGVKGNN